MARELVASMRDNGRGWLLELSWQLQLASGPELGRLGDLIALELDRTHSEAVELPAGQEQLPGLGAT